MRDEGSADVAADRPDAADGWNDLVVVCAANNYSGIKLADQHFAEQLSKLVPVLYVDPPISLLTPLKNRRAASLMGESRLRIQSPGLARLTPVVEPFPTRRGLTGITAAIVRRYLRRAVAELGSSRVRAVITGWPHCPVFGACREEVSVYWAQDDFVGGAALLGFNASHLESLERRIAGRADFVVAANPLVAETWKGQGHDVVLIPYGADVDSYRDVDQASEPADIDLPAPIVGFVGHINRRIDMQVLEAIADRGMSLMLVGPKDPAFEPQRFADLTHRANVHWVGAKPFEKLPGYFRRIDVGIVPYGDSPFNRGSFPLKTLEYLAAGRAVVSTDLPATRWLATDLVTIASEPESFAAEVNRMLGVAREPALVARRRQFAAAHSWAARASAFQEAIVSRQRPVAAPTGRL
jgi:teichuronic acid biosynthesis glycosyltransferase TuaH